MKILEPKHILFLSIDGMTDPLGQSQVLPYLSGLSRLGYRISLISCEKPDRYVQQESTIRKICKDARIDWQPLKYQSKPPLISSLANLRRMRKKAIQIHKNDEVHLLHCRSYLPMFTGMALKKKYGIPILFDIRGFWPDERVDGGLWDLKHPLWNRIYGYFKRKEVRFFESSDHVISLTHNAAREIHSWKLKNNPVPIDVIPCCTDLNLFDYQNISDDRQEVLLNTLELKEEDFIISYIGSLGTFYAIEDMLSYFKEAKLIHPNAKFLVITASPHEIVWNAVDKIGLDPEDVRVTKAARNDVPLNLSLSKYSLVFYKENYSRKACSPTKLGELMGLGIPVVCSHDVGDTTEIVENTKSGVTLSAMTPESFREAVESMADFPTDQRKSIRDGACQYFDLASGIKKYRAVYAKLTG